MYVGCGTLAGKCRWFTVLAFVLLSGALWITFQVEGSKCELCDRPTSTDEEPANCRKWSSSEEEYDVTTMVVEGCSLALVGGSFFGGIFALILALIPCFLMCCCASPPPTQLPQKMLFSVSPPNSSYSLLLSKDFKLWKKDPFQNHVTAPPSLPAEAFGSVSGAVHATPPAYTFAGPYSGNAGSIPLQAASEQSGTVQGHSGPGNATPPPTYVSPYLAPTGKSYDGPVLTV